MTLRTPVACRRYAFHVSCELARPLALLGLVLAVAGAAVRLLEYRDMAELLAR